MRDKGLRVAADDGWADLFSRVAWQLRTRAGVRVFAWLPVLGYELADPALQRELRQSGPTESRRPAFEDDQHSAVDSHSEDQDSYEYDDRRR